MQKPTRIAVQPLGKVSQSDLAAVKAALRSAFDLPVTVRAEVKLPSAAYYKPRRRYRADALLKTLGEGAGAGEKVIGITAVDISTKSGEHQDWAVFGLGELPGNACVVSKFRLRKQGELRARKRLARVAIHEVVHTLGLDHCPNHGCIMADAKGAIASVDAGAKFCDSCRLRAANAVLPNRSR